MGKWHCVIILSDHRQKKDLVFHELSLAVDKWAIWPLVYLIDPMIAEGFISVIPICNSLLKMDILFIVGLQSPAHRWKEQNCDLP